MSRTVLYFRLIPPAAHTSTIHNAGEKQLQQKVEKISAMERGILYRRLKLMITVSSEESPRSFFRITQNERETSMDGSKLIDIGR